MACSNYNFIWPKSHIHLFKFTAEPNTKGSIIIIHLFGFIELGLIPYLNNFLLLQLYHFSLNICNSILVTFTYFNQYPLNLLKFATTYDRGVSKKIIQAIRSSRENQQPNSIISQFKFYDINWFINTHNSRILEINRKRKCRKKVACSEGFASPRGHLKSASTTCNGHFQVPGQHQSNRGSTNQHQHGSAP